MGGRGWVRGTKFMLFIVVGCTSEIQNVFSFMNAQQIHEKVLSTWSCKYIQLELSCLPNDFFIDFFSLFVFLFVFLSFFSVQTSEEQNGKKYNWNFFSAQS